MVLISNILQPEPARRYTVQHIMAHSWLYKRRNKFAIVRPPDVDKVTKQKVGSNSFLERQQATKGLGEVHGRRIERKRCSYCQGPS